ncbi:hypothetical protein V1264_007880 [Littorina saxatilis]|uniref:Uncharacterized protein n=2 Tax=Littorina saxatilis TaxID=31220 RepID=A0AAN9G3T5_9CAEN
MQKGDSSTNDVGKCIITRVCVVAGFGNSAICSEKVYTAENVSLFTLQISTKRCIHIGHQRPDIGWFTDKPVEQWIAKCWNKKKCSLRMGNDSRPVRVGVMMSTEGDSPSISPATCLITLVPRTGKIIPHSEGDSDSGCRGVADLPGSTSTYNDPHTVKWIFPASIRSNFHKHTLRQQRSKQNKPHNSRKRRGSYDDKLFPGKNIFASSIDAAKNIIFGNDDDNSDAFTGELTPDQKIWESDLPEMLSPVMTFPDDYMNRAKEKKDRKGGKKGLVKPRSNKNFLSSVKEPVENPGVKPLNRTAGVSGKDMMTSLEENIEDRLQSSLQRLMNDKDARAMEDMSLDSGMALTDNVNEVLSSVEKEPRMGGPAADAYRLQAGQGQPPPVSSWPAAAVGEPAPEPNVVIVPVMPPPPLPVDKLNQKKTFSTAQPTTTKNRSETKSQSTAPAHTTSSTTKQTTPKPTTDPTHKGEYITLNPNKLINGAGENLDPEKQFDDSYIQANEEPSQTEVAHATASLKEGIFKAELTFQTSFTQLKKEVAGLLRIKYHPKRKKLLHLLMSGIEATTRATAWTMVREVCEEPLQQMRMAATGWMDWSAWSACTVTCGTSGYHMRRRICMPDHACIGSNFDLKPCHQQRRCQGSATWLEWSIWGDCSVSCGDGQKARSRNCLTDDPDLMCQGDGLEFIVCAAHKCRKTVTSASALTKTGNNGNQSKKVHATKATSQSTAKPVSGTTSKPTQEIKDKKKKQKKKKPVSGTTSKPSQEIKDKKKQKKKKPVSGTTSKPSQEIKDKKKQKKKKPVSGTTSKPKQEIKDKKKKKTQRRKKKKLKQNKKNKTQKGRKEKKENKKERRQTKHGRWSRPHSRSADMIQAIQDFDLGIHQMEGLDSYHAKRLYRQLPKAVKHSDKAPTQQGFVSLQPTVNPGLQTATMRPEKYLWSAWGMWSHCSVSCGKGTQFRRRECMKQIGDTFEGEPVKMEFCRGGQEKDKKYCSEGVCPLSVAIPRNLRGIEVGGNASVTCQHDFKGHIAAVHWITPDGERITSETQNDKYRMNNLTLIIRNAHKADLGQYTCVLFAENQLLHILESKQQENSENILRQGVVVSSKTGVGACIENPCENGGSCETIPNAFTKDSIHYVCKCREGYYGQHCEQKSMVHDHSPNVELFAMIMFIIMGFLFVLCTGMFIYYKIESRRNRLDDVMPVMTRRRSEDQWRNMKSYEQKGPAEPHKKITLNQSSISQRLNQMWIGKPPFQDEDEEENKAARVTFGMKDATNSAQDPFRKPGKDHTKNQKKGQTKKHVKLKYGSVVNPDKTFSEIKEDEFRRFDDERLTANLAQPSQLEREVRDLLDDRSHNASPSPVETKQEGGTGRPPTLQVNATVLYSDDLMEIIPDKGLSCYRGLDDCFEKDSYSLFDSGSTDNGDNDSLFHSGSKQDKDNDSLLSSGSKGNKDGHGLFASPSKENLTKGGMREFKSKPRADQNFSHPRRSSPGTSQRSKRKRRSKKDSGCHNDAAAYEYNHNNSDESNEGSTEHNRDESPEAAQVTAQTSSTSSPDGGHRSFSMYSSTENGEQSGGSSTGARPKVKSVCKHKTSVSGSHRQSGENTAPFSADDSNTYRGAQSSWGPDWLTSPPKPCRSEGRNRSKSPDAMLLKHYEVLHPDEPYPYRQTRSRRSRDAQNVLNSGRRNPDRREGSRSDEKHRRRSFEDASEVGETEPSQAAPCRRQRSPTTSPQHFEGGGEGASAAMRSDTRKSGRDTLLRRAMENSFIRATTGQDALSQFANTDHSSGGSRPSSPDQEARRFGSRNDEFPSTETRWGPEAVRNFFSSASSFDNERRTRREDRCQRSSDPRNAHHATSTPHRIPWLDPLREVTPHSSRRESSNQHLPSLTSHQRPSPRTGSRPDTLEACGSRNEEGGLSGFAGSPASSLPRVFRKHSRSRDRLKPIRRQLPAVGPTEPAGQSSRLPSIPQPFTPSGTEAGGRHVAATLDPTQYFSCWEKVDANIHDTSQQSLDPSQSLPLNSCDHEGRTQWRNIGRVTSGSLGQSKTSSFENSDHSFNSLQSSSHRFDEAGASAFRDDKKSQRSVVGFMNKLNARSCTSPTKGKPMLKSAMKQQTSMPQLDIPDETMNPARKVSFDEPTVCTHDTGHLFPKLAPAIKISEDVVEEEVESHQTDGVLETQFDRIGRRPCGPLDLDVFFSSPLNTAHATDASPETSTTSQMSGTSVTDSRSVTISQTESLWQNMSRKFHLMRAAASTERKQPEKKNSSLQAYLLSKEAETSGTQSSHVHQPSQTSGQPCAGGKASKPRSSDKPHSSKRGRPLVLQPPLLVDIETPDHDISDVNSEAEVVMPRGEAPVSLRSLRQSLLTPLMPSPAKNQPRQSVTRQRDQSLHSNHQGSDTKLHSTSQQKVNNSQSTSQQRVNNSQSTSQQRVNNSQSTSQQKINNSQSTSQQRVNNSQSTSQQKISKSQSTSQQRVNNSQSTSQQKVNKSQSSSLQKVSKSQSTSQQSDKKLQSTSQERASRDFQSAEDYLARATAIGQSEASQDSEQVDKIVSSSEQSSAVPFHSFQDLLAVRMPNAFFKPIPVKSGKPNKPKPDSS